MPRSKGRTISPSPRLNSDPEFIAHNSSHFHANKLGSNAVKVGNCADPPSLGKCRASVRPELERETQQSQAVFKKAIRKKDICKNGIPKKERDRGK
jgi:hypothetical protein